MKNDDISRIARCTSEHLCIQNGVIYEAENPINPADLGMGEPGEDADDLGTKLTSAGFQRVQKTPEIMGYGMKLADGRWLVMWDSETPAEGQWSVVSGSEVTPSEDRSSWLTAQELEPTPEEDLERYRDRAEWEAGIADAEKER